MEKEKIDETKILFWSRLELKIMIGTREIGWVGWQAALMHELMISGAVMTRKGAHDLVLAGGKARVGAKKVKYFIDEACKDGLLEMRYERSVKTGRRRQLFASMIEPSQLKYKKIIHEEEE